MRATHQKPLELWGGVECTVNRVGDRFLTQLGRNGHRARLSDLDLFAELGLRTLRFPILWDELSLHSPDEIAWTNIDAQLDRMRTLGIDSIAGLVHHGSGPRETSLIDPRFGEKLAEYARRVAERYPWIDAYTPINEPLTTARFSGLYGYWYPHGRDGFTFVRAFLNQCRGIVLAMRAIREVNPRAALVQTEDLGKTSSSPSLRYQADFENERRWLTWDLLCGRVDREHPMWSYLLWLGAEERDISFFNEHPCPPQLIGVNHYVTSERYLDENLRDHPPETHGGNAHERYADLSAVRASAEGTYGPERLLRETCERYRLPVAVTEAHLACTRDEQLRWLAEIWKAAQTLRDEGCDIRAVTAWSLLGALDWNSLLTRDDGCYESGAFDLRSGIPRPTAVARMIRSLARTGKFEHPVLDTLGWWRRPMRLLPHVTSGAETCAPGHSTGLPPGSLQLPMDARIQPLLITGARGRLGTGFIRAAESRALAYRAMGSAELDVTDREATAATLQAIAPWAIINCAGFSNIDQAESERQACRDLNIEGALHLADYCAAAGIPFVTFSSDQVFDGNKTASYVESDLAGAANFFGETKAIAEQNVLARCAHALIIRSGKVFASFGETDFLLSALSAIAGGDRVEAANDIQLSAVFLPDLVNATLDLLIDGETGVWHLANSGIVTPAGLLVAAANILELDTGLIDDVPLWTLRRAAARPRMRALASERGQLLPPLPEALHRYCGDLPPFEEPTAVAIR